MSNCLKDAMKQLETETVRRVNCENCIKGLEEKLTFTASVHKQVGLYCRQAYIAFAVGFAQTVCFLWTLQQ